MELAGRYFGTGFDSAPIMLMMPVDPGQELSTKPFETMGGITSPRVPSPLKASDYISTRKPPGKFSTASRNKPARG
jgi:hypothetical protein